MASDNNSALGNEPKTSVVYVGVPRFKSLTAVAIEVSHKSGRLVNPSQVVHYLIDNHLGLIESMMIRELTKSSDEILKQS
jgi:hypothetical protein